MAVFSWFILFVLMWWLVIFTTLPFGNRPSGTVTLGHAASAPARHNLGKKLVATTLIAFILTWPAYYGVQHVLKNVREDANMMALEDQIK